MRIIMAGWLALGACTCQHDQPTQQTYKSAPLPLLADTSVETEDTPSDQPSATSARSSLHAEAELSPVSNSLLSGKVELREEEAGLRVIITILSGAPGLYRADVHQYGRCDGPLAAQAGAVYDPLSKGFTQVNGGITSMGALGTVSVYEDGQGRSERFLYSSRYDELRFADWGVLADRAIIIRKAPPQR